MTLHDVHLPKNLKEPWLVAAWPGMGHVGILAATYLLEQLGAEQLGEVQIQDYADLSDVSVKRGLMQPPRQPRGVFYAWRDPEGRRDLVIFLSEAQPQSRGYSLCEELIGVAARMGIQRITTFAAMASPIDPQSASRVHTMATDAETLARFTDAGAVPLAQGEISGLNGVLLVAGHAHDLPG
ncbi:MAG: PAC2 family protein, partial [Planctomycetota bacterium]